MGYMQSCRWNTLKIFIFESQNPFTPGLHDRCRSLPTFKSIHNRLPTKMKLFPNLLLLVYLGYAVGVSAQTSFREGFEKAAPIPLASPLSLEEKVKIHQDFLDKSIRAGDTLTQLYGHVYLFTDYVRAAHYTEATAHLLEAESLANASGKPGWQGWIAHRRGILNLRLDDKREAIVQYERAVALCRAGGDSLCVAESLEQIATMYSVLDDFEEAYRYFKVAIPMIEKYAKESSVAGTLANFGGLLTRDNRPAEAIPYFERSIAIYQKIGPLLEEMQSWNNLGEAYYEVGNFNKSLKIFNHCVEVNKAHGFIRELVFNYSGLAKLYVAKGDMDNTITYINNYYDLRDSLVGAETHKEIADLEFKYASQQKELELQKSRVALGEAQRKLERGALIFLLVLLLVAFGLWRWRIQARTARREQTLNRENLENLTRILLEKNARLAALEAQDSSASESGVFEENLYDQRILTNEDWDSFKVYFERAYPGYLLRLRTSHPSLSDSEERLFLFIKLNLTTREAAAILGISAESVKKTRQRLRQRLNLAQEAVLEAYVRAF